MNPPAITGTIERRVLVNYAVDVDVLQRLLPAPFRVQAVGGVGIAGVCLIRMAGMRPRFAPPFVGLRSENAAHRVAVEWDAPDGLKRGVFVPRRDTSSRANALAGGRLFPGTYHTARFDVAETERELSIALRSDDGATVVAIEAELAERLPDASVFGSLEEASAFFEQGSTGWSSTDTAGCFDCIELRSRRWRVEPLSVRRVESSFFSDERAFPPGSIRLDSALLMRDVPHEWRAHAPLRVAGGAAAV